MSDRQQLAHELDYAREWRYHLCREAEAHLRAGLRAVELIRQGNPDGAWLLSQLCRRIDHEGDVLCVPVDRLIAADTEQRIIVAQLDEMDAAEEKEK